METTESNGSPEVAELKARCPLPVLLERLGLGACAKPSCCSPFRKDENASWGIFEREGQWFWKDHGTGESGDEITFLAQYLKLDSTTDFPRILDRYREIASQLDVAPPRPQKPPEQKLPDRRGFALGTEDQIARLSQLRGISVDALRIAQDRGFLVFGVWNTQEVFGITDQSGKALEIRRLDGELFPSIGDMPARKSHAIAGSQKKWPIGILESQAAGVLALVEGIPDFLAVHDFILLENRVGQVAPIGIFGAANNIHEEALVHFKDKEVCIYAHADVNSAGAKAAEHWLQQLKEAGAKEVKIFDLTRVAAISYGRVKDLNDLLKNRNEAFVKEVPELSAILPYAG